MGTTILVVNTSLDIGLTAYLDDVASRLLSEGVKAKKAHYTQLGEFDVSDFDGIVLTPTEIGDEASTDSSFADELDTKVEHCVTLKSATCPVFGICGGHHLLGRLYGAECIGGREREVGDNFDVTLLDCTDPIFDGVENDVIRVKQFHNNSITLPEKFTLLARSPKCKVQMMKQDSMPFYGAQFHAEQHSRLLRNFITIVQQCSDQTRYNDGGNRQLTNG